MKKNCYAEGFAVAVRTNFLTLKWNEDVLEIIYDSLPKTVLLHKRNEGLLFYKICFTSSFSR